MKRQSFIAVGFALIGATATAQVAPVLANEKDANSLPTTILTNHDGSPTGNSLIDHHFPGISVIDIFELKDGDNVVALMQQACRYIRSINQDSDYENYDNIFGKKGLPLHYNYQEMIDGYTAAGHPITLHQAHSIAYHLYGKLVELGMIAKLVPPA